MGKEMTTSEAIKHLFKTLSAYKERCNSEWCDKDKESIEILTEIAKKQEQGLIIELPVPIGTEFYEVMKDLFGEWVITTASIENWTSIRHIKQWGKLAFATREEAEAKLKELKEKK